MLSALDHRGISYDFIFAGQHKDYEMSWQFIQELGFSNVTQGMLAFTSTTPASQTADIMKGVEHSIIRLKPSLVVVQGDTNTTLAATIAAVKQNLPVAHVEAGLRSFDWRMPEEHNRRIVDHLSTLLFAPTKGAKENLLREHVMGKVFVTGNTIVDAILHYFPIAQECSKIMNEIKFEEYVLATFHRAENVDDPHFLGALLNVMEELPLPMVIPLHPRTLKRLGEYNFLERLGVLSHKVQVLSPLGYFDFLVAMKNCRLVLTDSGGLQEEATVPGLQKPTVVVRKSTERPEAVEAGFATLAGIEGKQILEAVYKSLETPVPNISSPFGNGQASEIIASILDDFLQSGKPSQHAT